MPARNQLFVLFAALALSLAPLACGEKGEEDADDTGDGGADGGDTDSDGDTDSETGSDTDTDADTDADTDGCAPATVAEVCTKVFECGGWGWPDQGTCESCFINASGTECEGYETPCVDEEGYLACVCACLELSDCTEFGDCEWEECWTPNCE
jgi:hypothetical protein